MGVISNSARGLISTVLLDKEIPLSVKGYLIKLETELGHRGDAVVVGIIAGNPFYGSKRIPQELENSHLSDLGALKSAELIVCSLRDWHDESDRMDKYVLAGFEIADGGRAQIIRPFGTWR